MVFLIKNFIARYQGLFAKLLALIGCIFLMLIAAQGEFNSFGLNVQKLEHTSKIYLGVVGAIGFFVCLFFLGFHREKTTLINECGVKIIYPNPRAIESFKTGTVISGSFEALPRHTELWLFAIYGAGSTAKYWPHAAIDASDRKWRCNLNIFNPKQGEKRKFGLFAVGPNGLILVQYFREAGAHLTQAKGSDGGWLGISRLTSDIVLCESFEVSIEL